MKKKLQKKCETLGGELVSRKHAIITKVNGWFILRCYLQSYIRLHINSSNDTAHKIDQYNYIKMVIKWVILVVRS